MLAAAASSIGCDFRAQHVNKDHRPESPSHPQPPHHTHPYIPLLPNTPTDLSTWVVAMMVTRTNTWPDNVVPTKNPLLPLFQAVCRGASELFIGDCLPHSDRYSWLAGRCPCTCRSVPSPPSHSAPASVSSLLHKSHGKWFGKEKENRVIYH